MSKSLVYAAACCACAISVGFGFTMGEDLYYALTGLVSVCRG